MRVVCEVKMRGEGGRVRFAGKETDWESVEGSIVMVFHEERGEESLPRGMRMFAGGFCC
jgi:hypothetical protein